MPGGEFPGILSVPPTRRIVIKSQLLFTVKLAPFVPFSVGPKASSKEPPLLPVKTVVGENVIVTFLPWQSLISKMAGCADGVLAERNICPVELLVPS